MNNWTEITRDINNQNDTSDHSNCIIEKLSDSIETFFALHKRSEKTRLIKKELSKLGHELCFKVYANRLEKKDISEITHNPKNPKCKSIGKIFKNREWLYDLHWYTEGLEPYSPTSLPLAMECEWDYKRHDDRNKTCYGAVKFDFQKLIVCNARLRLMIFKVNNKDLESLGKYFENVINSYKHLEMNAKFLFVAFDNKNKKAFYKILNKN